LGQVVFDKQQHLDFLWEQAISFACVNVTSSNNLSFATDVLGADRYRRELMPQMEIE